MTHLLSPFRCGSTNGIYFGAYLTVMYVAMAFPSSGLLGAAMMLGVPFGAFCILRRDMVRASSMWTVGALWADGMLSFLGGALLSSFAVFVMLRWGSPDFLMNQFETAIEMFETSGDPQMMENARICREALDSGFRLTPIFFAMSLMWLAAFSGSILSLLLALIVKATTRNKRPPMPV